MAGRLSRLGRRRTRDGPGAAEEPDAVVAGPSPAGLLRPDRAVVAFTGRAGELTALQAWCAARAARSVRLIVGAAGVGKTRLALQLAAARQAGGEVVRQVAPGDEARAVAKARAATAGPVLLIADEAETRAGLADLLRAVVADAGPVRLLLAARSLGEWWDRLAERSPPEVARLLAGEPVLPVDPALAPGVPDADVAAAAVPDFARALGRPRPVAVEVERSAQRLPVQVLHAAALLAVLRSGPGAATRVRVVINADAVPELLPFELWYWHAAAAAAGLGHDDSLVTHALTAAALIRPASVGEAAVALARLPELSGGEEEQRLRWARWLCGADPSRGGEPAGPRQPDALAEAYVVAELSRDTVLARSLLRHLPDAQAERAMTLLARARDHQDAAAGLIQAALRYDLSHLAVPVAGIATQGQDDLADQLAAALWDTPATPETLAEIALRLPRPSVVLAEPSLIATLRTRESLPPAVGDATRAEWDDRVAWLLAQLPDADPREGAGSAGRSPGAGEHRLWLASALTRLARRFGQAGRIDEAVLAQGRAIAILRGLARHGPSARAAALASCLSDLGGWLAEAGRIDEAIEAAGEAADIFGELLGAGADRYQPGLATALADLGLWCAQAGRADEALRAGAAAVAAYRRLETDDPERYRPELANGLTRLGVWYSGAGRPAEALAAELEAVELYHQLVAADAGRHRAGLASSLTGLNDSFAQLGRPEDALEPAAEAVSVYRELAAADPQRYSADLARTLATLGLRHAEAGKPEAALQPTREAVAIQRTLATASPGQRGGLAQTLNRLADVFSALGREGDAAEARHEATAISGRRRRQRAPGSG